MPHPPPPAPAELDLLLALYRGDAAAGQAQAVDWTFFLALVDHHRLAGLIQAPAWLPPPVSAALDERRRRLAFGQLALQADLVRVAGALNGAGVRWLALKGPAFAQLLYGPPLLRPSRDLDILVAEPDEAAARAALASLGYRGAARHAWDCQGVLRNRAGAVLELHVAFFDNRRKLPVAALAPFDAPLRLSVAGQPVPALALSQTAIYAAVHGLKHFWRRLFWLVDMDVLARHRDMDWEGTLRLARGAGADRHLAAALLHAERLFGTPLPTAVQARQPLLRRAEVSLAALDRLAAYPILASDDEAVRRFGRLRSLWWEAGLAGRPADRLGVFLHAAQPSPRDVPQGWLPAVLVRPFRLLRAEIRAWRSR